MGTKLRVEEGATGVSIDGTWYGAKDGAVDVSAQHAEVLQNQHGMVTVDEHRRREKQRADAARAEADRVRQAAAEEQAQRVAEARALLEAAGMTVSKK